MDLSSLLEEAQTIQSKDYIETVDKATAFLRKEKGQVGNLTIIDRLVKLQPLGEALVVGDLHGDLESLSIILQTSGFIKKMKETKDATLIFLGDYGDRGDKSAEIYWMILQLKLSFPSQIVLLRGNHEAPENLLGTPHDLPIQFQAKFGRNWNVAYEKTRTLWTYLYNAVYVEDRYLMLHGGVSPEIRNLRDMAEAKENQNEALLEELLWNDPDENVENVSPSPRGTGRLFGEKVTKQVLGRLKAKLLVRGHEPSGVGFKINHGGKVLTLFSRKGSPYFNRYGAYLRVPLTEKPENAKELALWICKF